MDLLRRRSSSVAADRRLTVGLERLRALIRPDVSSLLREGAESSQATSDEDRSATTSDVCTCHHPIPIIPIAASPRRRSLRFQPHLTSRSSFHRHHHVVFGERRRRLRHWREGRCTLALRHLQIVKPPILSQCATTKQSKREPMSNPTAQRRQLLDWSSHSRLGAQWTVATRCSVSLTYISCPQLGIHESICLPPLVALTNSRHHWPIVGLRTSPTPSL